MSYAAACRTKQVDGDKLQGRGVTDCLGHVALLTELFRQLAVLKPKLRPTVLGCFIANEENATVSDKSF
jgi:acetylornithine deacetylase